MLKYFWPNVWGQKKKKNPSPFVLLAKHVLISYSKVFSTSLTDMSLKVEKNSRIFRSRSVVSVGSGYALRAWKILDFEFPRYFNIAILATKTALKHQWKSSITLANPIANIIVKTKLNWRKNRLLSRSTHNWTRSVFFYWMRMGATAQCSLSQTQRDLTFDVQKDCKYKKGWWLGNNNLSFIKTYKSYLRSFISGL